MYKLTRTECDSFVSNDWNDYACRILLFLPMLLVSSWDHANYYRRETREFRRVITAGDSINPQLLMHPINVLFSLSNSA